MPVIMMSGHATIDTAVEATRIGALNFLEKPISLQKLLKAVQQGLTKPTEPMRSMVSHRIPVTAEAGMMHQPNYNGVQAAQLGAHHTLGNSFDTRIVPPPIPINPLAHFSFDTPLREARDSFERIYFEYHLQREGGSMTRVAERTGLERTHLYRKLKQLGVESLKSSKRHS
jgi:DNA-binding NtrC family response regulator